MTKTSAERVKAHTERLVNRGGVRLTIKLQPVANAILEAYCAKHGVSRTKAIHTAIEGLK